MVDAVNKRVERRVFFKKNINFFPKKIKISNVNISCINNLEILKNYHFENNDIPFINLKNYKQLINCDFRYGWRFKNIFFSNLNLYGNVNNYFFVLFLDDTIVNDKKVKVVYLYFMNDLLINLKKKKIYTILTVNTEKFKKIKIEFYKFLLEKIQNELLSINNNIKGNLLCIIADNVEAFEILNLKANFKSQNFQCRFCFQQIKNLQNNLNNYEKLKSNKYYLDQIKLNSIDKNLKKINSINGLTSFITIENFDYVFTVVLEAQHVEFEGEVFRDLVLFFLTFPDLKIDERMQNLKIFLKKKYNLDISKIENFLLRIDEFKKKVFNINIDNIDIKFKKIKTKILSSSETNYFFKSILIFFYDFFLKNLQNDVIQIYISHYIYLNIILQNYFIEDDLNYLQFLVKRRINLYLKNRLKICPKSLFSLHYQHFIEAYGPIKFISSFIFENHNHTIKYDVPKTTKNPAVTCLKKNYCFFDYEQIPYYSKPIGFEKDYKIISFVKYSNHLISPNQNVVYNGKIFLLFFLTNDKKVVKK